MDARIARQYWWAWIETLRGRSVLLALGGIARQYWWAWIETTQRLTRCEAGYASPASIGGRGLKQTTAAAAIACCGIARQYWWAWIETATTLCPIPQRGGIARQYWWAWIETGRYSASAQAGVASPASIGGRGLKHLHTRTRTTSPEHRPPVLVGVD